MKMKNKMLALFIILVLLFPTSTLAQDETPSITLTLTRDFGYGGFGGDIQGTFSMKASGPDDLMEVQFYIDDLLIGTDTEAPFRIQFHTDGYEPGVHTLFAVGVLANGSQIQSNQFVREFLSGDKAMGTTLDILVPLLAIIIGISVIGVVVPMLLGKKGKQYPIGEYSAAGGAVCPRCGFPYSRHILGMNLLFGKLERCPHCGKLAIVRRATPDELAAAEERLRADREAGVKDISKEEDESLRRAIEDSRFDD
jgi:hypothetical protein